MPYLPIAKPDEIGFDPARLARAYELLDLWTRSGEVPGGALTVGRHGRIVEPRFFGRMGPEPDAARIRSDAVFLTASITKPIVYLGAMILVERGELNLSDKVTRYLPDFAAHHKDETLVLHLFTHTSGLPDMLPENTELRRAHAPISQFVERTMLSAVPLFQPGTGLSYQSMGTAITAEIVRKISGKPIDEFLQSEIFEPLSLRSIALGARSLDRDRRVRVQVPEGQDPGFDWNSRYWQELGAPWGGLFSAPADLAVVCQLMLGGGEVGGVRIVSPATTAAITRNWLETMPGIPESDRRTRPWGLGWCLNHPAGADTFGDLLGPRTFGHFGATGTMAWMDPDSDAFCVLLTSGIREKQPWKLVSLSNIVAGAVV